MKDNRATVCGRNMVSDSRHVSAEHLKNSAEILKKAKELGADLAGWVSIDELKNSPSCQFAPQMPYRRDEHASGAHRMSRELNLKHGEVSWPEGMESVLVIAVSHPEDQPRMDFWEGRRSPSGNRILMSIIKQLCAWIEQRYSYETFHLPYQVGTGGIYLKDAAALAGLGCIGANNLLVTPEFGPRVRLRALAVNVRMVSTGPTSFDPCAVCDKPCLERCPQKALGTAIYESDDFQGLQNLPGRTGHYNVAYCDREMTRAKETATEEFVEDLEENRTIVKYCRNCEFTCPVGR